MASILKKTQQTMLCMLRTESQETVTMGSEACSAKFSTDQSSMLDSSFDRTDKYFESPLKGIYKRHIRKVISLPRCCRFQKQPGKKVRESASHLDLLIGRVNCLRRQFLAHMAAH